LVAVVPSPRVSSEEFVGILADNGIEASILGRGVATVTTPLGQNRVAGVLVVAILSPDLRRSKAHARLCGVSLAPLEIEGCTSRANVI